MFGNYYSDIVINKVFFLLHLILLYKKDYPPERVVLEIIINYYLDFIDVNAEA